VRVLPAPQTYQKKQKPIFPPDRESNMLRYCARCVMPDTKPDLQFNKDGVCSACLYYENRSDVDWTERKRQLMTTLDRYRSKDESKWDCIVPVSGGKDSTFQVVRMLQMGLNPLCVTATTCDLSEIGRKNIENIKNMGVDYVEFSPNPIIRRKLNRIGLNQVGDISWAEHVGIFTIPVRAAVQFGIQLIIWGENSQNEYGGPASASENNILNRRWLEEFGGLLGLRVSDFIGMENISAKDMILYTYPSDEELKRVGVTGLFLGHYIPWDGYTNVLVSQGYGFQSLETTIEGSIVNYENLDNHQMGIHDYFKFLKFGFGRASDLACLHLRRGRLTRDDAMELTRRHDGKFPWSYLGKPLEKILDPLDISVDDFVKICDRFTNKKIFEKDAHGNLLRDKLGNLTKVNYDNP
jgi:N-acetyl sugar amidotransferase